MEDAERPELTRRAMVAGAAVMLGAAISIDPPPIALRGVLTQGGYAILVAGRGDTILLDGQAVGATAADGLAVVGFVRDAPASMRLGVAAAWGTTERDLAISARDWRVQRIDGLPPSTVAPTDPVLLARIAREAELKQAAFASRDQATGFAAEPWLSPAVGGRSSSFGVQRVLNGQPGRPHYGVDIAAPRGAAVVAPAAGLVVLAQPNLHFEGGLVLVDHGQGLVGAFLHLSRLDVAVGDRVARGASLGAVGASGRATGPHLCWRLKWRGRNLDPSLWLTPAATV